MLSYLQLVGGLEHEFHFSIYWESSSQLTFIFFRGVAKNHQPVIDDFPFIDDFPSYKPPFIHPKLRSETSETAVEVDPKAAMVDLWCGRRLGVDERCRVYSAKMGWSQRWAPQKGSLTWLD